MFDHAASLQDPDDHKDYKDRKDYEDAAKLTACCDRVRTEQIFLNLISNAIKFTPQGGSVKVKLDRDCIFARFRVVDTGQGIPAEFLPQLFEMFTQAPVPASLARGALNAGLGVCLALVRELVEAQGGRVHADLQASKRVLFLPAGYRLIPGTVARRRWQ